MGERSSSRTNYRVSALFPFIISSLELVSIYFPVGSENLPKWNFNVFMLLACVHTSIDSVDRCHSLNREMNIFFSLSLSYSVVNWFDLKTFGGL